MATLHHAKNWIQTRLAARAQSSSLPATQGGPVRVAATRVGGPTPLQETLRTLLDPGLDADLNRARRLATLLDSRFQVAGIKFGLEGIIGLLPVVGDTIGTAIGLYPLYLAQRHNLGTGVKARMAANLALDWAVGLVPLLGDLFDIAYKANLKNFALLENAITRKLRR
jgi:hypothetical protein